LATAGAWALPSPAQSQPHMSIAMNFRFVLLARSQFMCNSRLAQLGARIIRGIVQRRTDKRTARPFQQGTGVW
jgi:hypothetical protein